MSDEQPTDEKDEMTLPHTESTAFDRFMDKILIVEAKKRTVAEKIEHPQRIRQARRQERPAGRTVIKGVR